ncbi:uncharacterized protein FIESC28_00494 [Fusarium coffeatum]|uniref:Uncharacterized protein n=1 Tax=Fusarium coffeatum TaxID=231269 RepID=A0A366SBJ9_9HYPO|nr:uncharacterized protein FIESC28_00494 [Fusarium coffeatum]RBR26711.1 hypothetical protein FIESC28_00494 [Fusarium coffeatum]
MTSPLDDDHAPARAANKPTQTTAPTIGKSEAYISSGAVSVGGGDQFNGNHTQYHSHIEHDNHTENHDHSRTYNFNIPIRIDSISLFILAQLAPPRVRVCKCDFTGHGILLLLAAASDLKGSMANLCV